MAHGFQDFFFVHFRRFCVVIKTFVVEINGFRVVKIDVNAEVSVLKP